MATWTPPTLTLLDALELATATVELNTRDGAQSNPWGRHGFEYPNGDINYEALAIACRKTLEANQPGAEPTPEHRALSTDEDSLYDVLVRACQVHGFTTEHTYDLIHRVIESINTDCESEPE